MADLNPWETLGLAPGASAPEIRRAYRRLARRYHPDLNPEDPEAEARFKEVQTAYEVLMERQNGKVRQHNPSQAYSEPRPHFPSVDDDPFLSILAAYVRRRSTGDQ